jgi:hypothetical protein
MASDIDNKYAMHAMGEPGSNDLPRAISAEELQIMLGTSQAICPRDGLSSPVSKLLERWPFLLSYPLMGTYKKPTR